MKIQALLLPKNQNEMQRKGYAATLLLMVLLIFLHNPLDGYQVTKSIPLWRESHNPDCSSKEISDAKHLDLQSKWPLNKWDEFQGFEPIPEGILDGPIIKELQWRNSVAARAKKVLDKCISIHHYSREEVLPFSEWMSNAPLFSWLGQVIHLLGAIFGLAVAGVIWLLVFQTKGNSAQ